MPSSTEISPTGGWAAATPLAVAYVLLPLWAACSRFAPWLPEPSSPAVWTAVAGAGLLAALRRPGPGASASRGLSFRLVAVLLFAGLMVRYLPDWRAAVEPALPYLKEASPVVYGLFAVLWASTCGLPDRADFQRFGAWLGGLCILDLGVEALLFHAAPTVRMLGDSDVLAGLLLVALCAGLRPGENRDGEFEPDQGRAWWRGLIMFGLAACLSRTGLFGAAWVVLCFGRGGPFRRALYAAFCLLVLTGTFFLPPTASDAVRYTDYWLWMEGVRLFSTTGGPLLTGFPINAPLPLVLPAGMELLWEAATGASALFGTYVSQVPPFWLRLCLAWGAVAPVALLCAVFALLLRRQTRLGVGLAAALFAQGMITPLLFDPSTGVCVVLAFVLALTPTVRPDPAAGNPR